MMCYFFLILLVLLSAPTTDSFRSPSCFNRAIRGQKHFVTMPSFSIPMDSKYAEMFANVTEYLLSDSNSTLAKEVSLTLSFAGNHKQAIKFDNSEKAVRYLSLPTNEYSVLRTDMVKRSIFSDNEFEITIPLCHFIFNYQNATNDTTFHGLHKYSLLTTLSVDPQPGRAKIVMKSGSFQFTPTPKEVIESVFTPFEKNSLYHNMSSLPSIVPSWLIWKDQSANQVDAPTMTALKSVDIPIEILKSAVQPKLHIEINWGQEKSLLRKMTSSMFNALTSFATPKRASGSTAIQTMPTIDQLEAMIKVSMSIDMHIRSKNIAAGKLQFTPLKLIAQQCGSFILSKLLGYVALPLFVPALLADYEKRVL